MRSIQKGIGLGFGLMLFIAVAVCALLAGFAIIAAMMLPKTQIEPPPEPTAYEAPLTPDNTDTAGLHFELHTPANLFSQPLPESNIADAKHLATLAPQSYFESHGTKTYSDGSTWIKVTAANTEGWIAADNIQVIQIDLATQAAIQSQILQGQQAARERGAARNAAMEQKQKGKWQGVAETNERIRQQAIIDDAQRKAQLRNR